MYDHNQISNPSIFIETLCPGGLVAAQVTKLSYTHSKILSSHILIFTGDSHKLESQKIYRQDLERSRSMHRTKSIRTEWRSIPTVLWICFYLEFEIEMPQANDSISNDGSRFRFFIIDTINCNQYSFQIFLI